MIDKIRRKKIRKEIIKLIKDYKETSKETKLIKITFNEDEVIFVEKLVDGLIMLNKEK